MGIMYVGIQNDKSPIEEGFRNLHYKTQIYLPRITSIRFSSALGVGMGVFKIPLAFTGKSSVLLQFNLLSLKRSDRTNVYILQVW